MATMAKKRKRTDRPEKVKGPLSTYLDDEGNQLVLRQKLSSKTIKQVDLDMGTNAANVEDLWQRRVEWLFERLAVSWEIAGLPLEDQKMLLGRYRMADNDTRKWVRTTVMDHVAKFIPELEGRTGL